MEHRLLTLEIHSEHDVVAARQRAREIAVQLGLGGTDQTRVSTALSEIARNAYEYTGGGRVEFAVAGAPGDQRFRITVRDAGPGIADVQAILDGRYRSPTGMGLGIVGTRRVMDAFEIHSAPGEGTRVVMEKRLPPERALDAAALARAADQLAARRPLGPLEEVRTQNRELLRALGELRARREELERLNRELEDTNRGVVALYAELDERVEQLRRSNSLRAQFTSYLSHEFRTPLDSVLALAGLLLERVDGELTEEQERQVGYIRRSARDLLHMVDDLLDTARVEAGQVEVRPESFTAADLFSALRATLRPLLSGEGVALVFEEPARPMRLRTDEAKVTQILRNFISNALKFTDRGEIRVGVADSADGSVTFSVTDTGIGIAPENQDWIFEDFTRVEGAVSRRVKGTGLGLPLSRKLARLLGGEVSVRSTLGEGSTFRLTLPREYPPSAPGAPAARLSTRNGTVHD